MRSVLRSGRRVVAVFTTIVLATGCGSSEPLDPADFVLSGTWTGTLTTGGGQFSVGELQLTLVGTRDGASEEYDGEGILFTSRNFRFQQVDGVFDTAAGTLELTILDFPTPVGVFSGTLNGTTLTIEETLLCLCRAVLSNADAGT